jgi:hypothetical protein
MKHAQNEIDMVRNSDEQYLKEGNKKNITMEKKGITGTTQNSLENSIVIVNECFTSNQIKTIDWHTSLDVLMDEVQLHRL